MKEIFQKFIQLRDSGWYNMITDKDDILRLLECSEDEYFDIINNFNKYLEIYG